MENEPDELIPTRWSLLERLKNWEDEEGWREFFETYWRLIYGVALKSELTPDEAQEVVQDTIISVCKNIAKFKADPAYGSFKNWLLQLTRWRIIDLVRKRPPDVLGRVHRIDHGSSEGLTSTATEERIPDPAPNALDVIWNEEWAKNMREVSLEKLRRRVSAKHYQVFYLVTIKEIPPEKVAKTLGIQLQQIYVVRHRLTQLLQKITTDLETKPV